MARTVTSPIVCPSADTMAMTEVADSSRGTGLAVIGGALNSLYEHWRGPLVNDYDPVSPYILTTTGYVARYRPRVDGGSSRTGEGVKVFLDVTMEESVPTGACVVTVTIDAPGGGTNTWTWTYSADISDTRVEATPTGTNAITDVAGYCNVTVEITTRTDMSKTWVKGVHVYYDRANAALDAVDSGEVAYDGSGVVPCELGQLDGEKPVSVARIQDMHTLARYIVTARLGQECTTSRPEAPIIDAANATRYLVVDVPVAHADVTLAVNLRYKVASGAGTPGGSIRIADASGQDSAGILVTGPVSETWGSLSLTLAPASERGPQPNQLRIALTTSITGVGCSATIYGVSAYWETVTL